MFKHTTKILSISLFLIAYAPLNASEEERANMAALLGENGADATTIEHRLADADVGDPYMAVFSEAASSAMTSFFKKVKDGHEETLKYCKDTTISKLGFYAEYENPFTFADIDNFCTAVVLTKLAELYADHQMIKLAKRSLENAIACLKAIENPDVYMLYQLTQAYNSCMLLFNKAEQSEVMHKTNLIGLLEAIVWVLKRGL